VSGGNHSSPDAPGEEDVTGTDAGLVHVQHASRPVKRSFSIRGHRTSISLEAAFWEALQEIAKQRALPLVQLVASIDAARGTAGLSGAVRIYILAHYRCHSADRAAGR
jgi:predicted DNA-binding ribbon-helix-helix protein